MKKLLFVLPIAVLLATGCNSPQLISITPTSTPVIQQTDSTPTPTPSPTPAATNIILNGSISYVKNDKLFTVSKKEFTILNQFTPTNLSAQSQGCGTNKDEQYFKTLLSNYGNDDKGVEYDFKYIGQSQGNDTWVVRVIPNKTGYSNFSNFQNDFNACEAGTPNSPFLMSQQNLAFYNVCGSGFDDGSGLTQGCFVVKDFVEPSIKLK